MCVHICQGLMLTLQALQVTSAQEYLDHSDLDHIQRERSELVTGMSPTVQC